MNKFFDITTIEFKDTNTLINLQTYPESFHTSLLPGIDKHLIKHLPALKYHLCDNEFSRTFPDELKDTEIAHAFEHVLLQKIGDLDPRAKAVKGETHWDWKKSPRFSYEIDLVYRNDPVVLKAISSSIDVFRKITPAQLGAAS